jgi:hypothetical protein
MSNTVVSLQSLLKRTMHSSDGKIVTTSINGRVSCVLDNCGTAKKLSDNFGRVKLYVLDTNTGDVCRDDAGRPYTFNRQWKNLSIRPWLKTSTATESNAQVKHAVVHCDVIRSDDGTYILDATGNRQFKWTIVPDTFVYLANAERPELSGVHQFGDTFDSVILAAQTKATDLMPAREGEDEDADLLADFDLARA